MNRLLILSFQSSEDTQMMDQNLRKFLECFMQLQVIDNMGHEKILSPRKQEITGNAWK
jgi:hypothetical protein